MQTTRQPKFRFTASIARPLFPLLLLLIAAPSFGQGHMHELYYNNSTWTDVDLTALTSGPPATYQGGIGALYTVNKPSDQFHVYYVDDTSSHVHQLYFKNSTWVDQDLTAFSGGPTAFPYAMSSFNIGNLQYVFYVGTDNNVHELSYNNHVWTDTDLTALTGAALAYYQGLVAFATKPNNQFHVYYQAEGNSGLGQLYFDGSVWTNQNISSLAGGANCVTDWYAGFAVENEQHIFCPGDIGSSSNLDMLHIYYNNSSWVNEDISVLTDLQTPMARFNVPVAAFPVKGEFEVYSVTDDDHVHQFTHKKSWTDVDLTASIGAPEVNTGGAVALLTTPNDQFHFYYQPETPAGEIYQLYFDGTSWAAEDLTNGEGNASGDGGMAGFAIGNLQYVFYISKD